VLIETRGATDQRVILSQL